MRRYILTFAAVALLLAACGVAGDSVVATVNGTDVTLADVQALRPDADSVDSMQFASDLQLILVNNIVRAGSTDLGITITEQQKADELALIVAQIEAPNAQTGETISFADFMDENNLSDGIVDAAVEQQLLNQQLIEHFSGSVEVTEEDIEAQFNSELQSRSEVCAAHILLEDEETADTVFELATADGADFSELAIEHSTGPSGPTGGVLGCSSPAGYVPNFAIATLDAPLNEPYGPIETEFGFHIVLVTSRETPVLEDVRDDLVATLQASEANAAVSAWFIGLVNDAVVTIDEQYGTWEDTGSGAPSVVAPSANA